MSVFASQFNQINPFAETPTGEIYAADAKIGFDDNASFRQQDGVLSTPYL